ASRSSSGREVGTARRKAAPFSQRLEHALAEEHDSCTNNTRRGVCFVRKVGSFSSIRTGTPESDWRGTASVPPPRGAAWRIVFGRGCREGGASGGSARRARRARRGAARRGGRHPLSGR